MLKKTLIHVSISLSLDVRENSVTRLACDDHAE